MEALPATGVPAARVLDELRALRGRDLPTHGGRLFAYVYDSGLPGLDELTTAAYGLAAHVNGLDPTAFPSLLALENALVAAAARLLSGDGATVGNVTSGGTESLLLAVKAARDSRPDLATPRLVVPASAHAAFAKAAAYLRVALDTVPVSPDTLRSSTSDIQAALRPETVLVAVSAPSYAHGVVDPVAEVAELAAARGIRCHVDACFGGFLLPYLRRLGVPVPAFDLSVPGVTSISVDLHKYAYAPKGVSVLLHRDAELRRPQYFAWAGWPGYTMVNPGVSSTRSGGPVAAAYATLRHIGDAGYLELARRTLAAVRSLVASVSTVEGLRLLGAPESSAVVCFASEDTTLDVFALADELAARGWHTQPQLRYDALPASLHLTVTAAVAPQVDRFGADLRDAVAATRRRGPVPVPPELLELEPADVTPALVAQLAASLGFSPGGGMATVNALLDRAPAPLRERLLVEFLSLLQSP
jgi:glutamate/tyrosine decarboxylase-like PLP-dependent enzyme